MAVLFSGGLDSTVLAALAHRHVPPGEPIDLLNVCFGAGGGGGPRARPHRRTAPPCIHCIHVPDSLTCSAPLSLGRRFGRLGSWVRGSVVEVGHFCFSL